MRRPQFAFAFGILVLAAAAAIAQENVASNVAAVTVTGEVTVVTAGGGHAERDASKVVVWLIPTNSVRPVNLAQEQRHYRLVQHHKHFDPEFLVVPVGSVVDFPNLDPWFHNVFSLYRGKRFDLGLYQAGSMRSVRFDRPGPSYLFCNIHPEMSGVVLAVDSDYFAVSNPSGHYAIPNVPAGKYTLHVWHENASLEALQRSVTVGASGRLEPVSVAVNKQSEEKHKNKYGQDYDPDTLKTDY